MKNTFIKPAFLAAFLIVGATILAEAQVSPPPSTPPPSSPPPSAGAPLDPLSWVILGAGGAVAAGKYYQVRKKK